ncbi:MULTISPECIES: DUF222 domain-containing protein [unclassified Arthrobacter]|uniref:DUF222 domain-containing protein n=1 Tax=unclassified Arthrobacter TaxID=235627 RepID=UPI002F42FCD9
MAVEPLDVVMFPADSSAGAPTGTLIQCVESVLGTANELREAATDSWGLLGLQEAVDFAAAVEDISRITDYLKLTAAAAIDQQCPASTLASSAAAGPTAELLRVVDGQEDVFGSATAVSNASPSSDGYGACSHAEPTVLPKGGGRRLREFRSTADFLRARLRISRAEARRRLAMAAALLPRPTLMGDVLPPAYPRVAQACADGVLAATDMDVVARALEEAVPRLEPEALEAMEKQLTDIGTYQDHDFLVRAAKHWTALLDQDRPPTEEELKQFQGIFPGRRRNGLNHLHIYCTDEQHEALTTLINSATNPRNNVQLAPVSAAGGYAPDHSGMPDDSSRVPEGCTAPEQGGAPVQGTSPPEGEFRGVALSTPDPNRQDSLAEPRVMDLLPRPTRPQLLLEGLLGAVRAALASGGLPAAGGLRPQVMVTISHDSLLRGLANTPGGMGMSGHRDRTAGTGKTPREAPPENPATADRLNHPDNPGNGGNEGDRGGSARGGNAGGAGNAGGSNAGNETRTTNSQMPGTAAFSGPIDARSVRRIACDADLIPMVLGSNGQVLDLGRAARLFPPTSA